ncbi:LysE family translocator [Craurococcus roseus]|uniref:LysE family translocator n=1 Tax=Craurococcus roseus TaxID=77585 RepID=A0ABN1FUK5_9PROT
MTPDAAGLLLFLAAALAIAVTPGPGIFYVAARTLAGGRGEGIASSFGTGLGGLVHVAAGALGVSALVMASAQAFTVLKVAGAAYLVWLGLRAIREARRVPPPERAVATGAAWAFREGVVVEALNPKTAAFFLAFIPQFVDPAQGGVALQFAALGLVSVALNTLVDVAVACAASRARDGLARRAGLVRRLREASGAVLCGLGVSLAFARRAG